MIHITTVFDQNCPVSYFDTFHKEEVHTGCGIVYDQVISADYLKKIASKQEVEMMITRLGGLSGRAPVETWMVNIFAVMLSTYPARQYWHIIYNNARKIETYKGPIHRNHKQIIEAP